MTHIANLSDLMPEGDPEAPTPRTDQLEQAIAWNRTHKGWQVLSRQLERELARASRDKARLQERFEDREECVRVLQLRSEVAEADKAALLEACKSMAALLPGGPVGRIARAAVAQAEPKP